MQVSMNIEINGITMQSTVESNDVNRTINNALEAWSEAGLIIKVDNEIVLSLDFVTALQWYREQKQFPFK